MHRCQRRGGAARCGPGVVGAAVRGPGKRARGFTLIELTIVVAILGILSTLAIRIWEGASIKAHIADALTVVSPMKLTIFDNLTLGQGSACSGITDITVPINSLVSATCADADGEVRVHVIMGEEAGRLVLDFVSDRVSTTQWRCVAAPEFVDFLYLPGNCQ